MLSIEAELMDEDRDISSNNSSVSDRNDESINNISAEFRNLNEIDGATWPPVDEIEPDSAGISFNPTSTLF